MRKIKEEYKLCYVDPETNKAWFTNNYLNQWGDDWDDRPYECNAGDPYDTYSILIEDNEDFTKRKWEHHPLSLKEVYFELPVYGVEKICDKGCYSVDEINKKGLNWFEYEDYSKDTKVKIKAGTKYEDFVRIIEETGGRIFVLKPAELVPANIPD